MNRIMKKILFILLAVATAAHATEWKTYVNDAVGYSVEYPANLRHIPYKEWAPHGDPNSAQQWLSRRAPLINKSQQWRCSRSALADGP